MKKLIYFLSLILLLFLINMIPTSAKEIKTCVRTEANLHVRDDVKNKNNLNDILTTHCVDEVDKVYDFANLLTDDEESKLYDEVNSYINNANYDLILVTTNENPKNSAREYADDFFDYNEFGKGETYDGVLILIDMASRELYISTSGYAIKMYDDYRIDKILDSGYNYIINEDYYNTFSSMIDDLNFYFKQNYPSSNDDLEIDSLGNPIYIKYIPYELVLVIACIITLVISLVLYFKSRLKLKVISIISYLKDKKITLRTDNLVNTIVTHTVRTSNYSSGGSSSSRGGGSSFHSSSSGRSHGGGGRRF